MHSNWKQGTRLIQCNTHFYSATIIFLVPSLIKNMSKLRHFLKNTTQVEITKTISTEILIKYYKTLSSNSVYSCNFLH